MQWWKGREIVVERKKRLFLRSGRSALVIDLGFTVIQKKNILRPRNHLTYPEIFESATFSSRIRPHVSGVSGRRIRSPEWKPLNPLCIRKRVNAKSGYFFNPLTSQDWAQFFTVNIQDGPRKEEFADSKISGHVWTVLSALSFINGTYQQWW